MNYRVINANYYEIMSMITAPVMTTAIIHEALSKPVYKVQFKKYLFWHDCKKDKDTIFFNTKEEAERYMSWIVLKGDESISYLIDHTESLDPEVSKFVDDNFWDLI